MNPSTAAVHGILHTIGCHLQEMARGEDDELISQVIRYVHHDHVKASEEAGMTVLGKDIPTLPAEHAAILTARGYAGVLGVMLDRILYPDEAEYTDENDEDMLYVEDVLQDYGTRYGNADADEDEDEDGFNQLSDALRCSIDAKALRMWIKTNEQEG